MKRLNDMIHKDRGCYMLLRNEIVKTYSYMYICSFNVISVSENGCGLFENMCMIV